MTRTTWQFLSITLALALVASSGITAADFRARDPGVRGGPPGAGGPLAGLTADEREMFDVGLEDSARRACSASRTARATAA